MEINGGLNQIFVVQLMINLSTDKTLKVFYQEEKK